jgi:hypothetical protein
VRGIYGTHLGGERCLEGFSWEVQKKRLLRRHRCKWVDEFKLDLSGHRDRWGEMDTKFSK